MLRAAVAQRSGGRVIACWPTHESLIRSRSNGVCPQVGALHVLVIRVHVEIVGAAAAQVDADQPKDLQPTALMNEDATPPPENDRQVIDFIAPPAR